jgi:hypothetical protein
MEIEFVDYNISIITDIKTNEKDFVHEAKIYFKPPEKRTIHIMETSEQKLEDAIGRVRKSKSFEEWMFNNKTIPHADDINRNNFSKN